MTPSKKGAPRRRWSRICPEIEEYRNFPGDSGKIMRLVYGNNDDEFDEDLDAEATERHRTSGGFGSTYRGK